MPNRCFAPAKYRPESPPAFASLGEARVWVFAFTRGYNQEHKHRNLKFVSLVECHRGKDGAIFAKRIAVYKQARAKHPERWSRDIRTTGHCRRKCG